MHKVRKLLRYKALFAFIFAVIAFLMLGLSMWSSPQTHTSVAHELPDFSIATASTTEDGAAPQLNEYIEIVGSCGPYFNGSPCVNLRSGPGMDYPVIMPLRNGMVLKVVRSVVVDGRAWYGIGFDGEVRYSERIQSYWYVAAEYARKFSDVGEIKSTTGIDTASKKRIVIDLTKELLYAYDGDTLFMQQSISTGLDSTPTQPGTFWIYKKMPDSYMQGPVPGVSDQYYDLPGVPWDLYFTMDGGAIHGAYWHDHFGQPWSHGCVNMPTDKAEILYKWADLGTPVIVQD